MSRYKIDSVAEADREYNGTATAGLNSPSVAWSSADITTEETALSDATLGITARVIIATSDYVKVKWYYNNKPLAVFKSRDYVQAEALAFLEEVKNEYDVWSTTGLDSLESLAVTAADASIAPEATTQLTVTATDTAEADTDVTSESTFWSSDEEVATVNDTGLVTAVADGTATISAEYRDEVATVEITVATA